jgi:hypothetical protein
MSEYQYYEFQAVDRPLSKAEQEEIRKLSSRSVVNSRSASFVYNYGDFRGDPDQLTVEYFDAMLYKTNWGSRDLFFRFPKSRLDQDAFEPYLFDMDGDYENYFDLFDHGDKILMKLVIHQKNYWDYEEEDEDEALLSNMIDLREDLMNGDLRLAYLAWLKAVVDTGLESEKEKNIADDDSKSLSQWLEPPVPAGLNELSYTHQTFIEWIGLNSDLVAAAAQASPPLPPTSESDTSKLSPNVEQELDQAFAHLKQELLHAAKNNTLENVIHSVGQKLSGVFIKHPKPKRALGQRTASQLRELAAAAVQQRKLEQQRKAEEARQKELAALAKREPEAWKEVEELCEQKTGKSYEKATDLLVKLNIIAQNQGRSIKPKITELAERYRNRSALLKRWREAGLL